MSRPRSPSESTRWISVIDSHTAGEPTRVIIDGGPDLGDGPLSQRVKRFRDDFDHFRTAVVNEPRGSDAMVGALLCKPVDPTCVAGVIFFNNVGYLNMCGHGTMGLAVTLAHLGRITPGVHRIETPVGVVTAELHAPGRVSITSVPSYRHHKSLRVSVPGHGPIVGDVAWGGNWFFLVSDHGQRLERDNIDALTDFTWRIRAALGSSGVTGADGAEIDHIELFGPSANEGSDSRNFVLCPGKAYDRSPCGTGTSAKLACLHADGALPPSQIWRQESIVGTIFEGWVEVADGQVRPTIRGEAFINAESQLLIDEADPFGWGIR